MRRVPDAARIHSPPPPPRNPAAPNPTTLSRRTPTLRTAIYCSITGAPTCYASSSPSRPPRRSPRAPCCRDRTERYAKAAKTGNVIDAAAHTSTTPQLL
eukprot:scaffold10274_cov106-Isochrysis_galbana.AAC.4